MDYNFAFVLRYQDALLIGLRMTVMISLASIAIGCLWGFVLGMARGSSLRWARVLATVYIEFFRGTPVIVQLFWVFFCLPLLLGIELSNMASGIVALSLYMGAISAESFRAALKTISPDQHNACVALGLSRYAEIRYVLMPQAILRAIPTLLSNCVSLFKESALVSAVGMADLMFVGQNISNATARPVEVLTVVALIYFVIAFPLTRGVTVLERKVLKGLAV